MLGENLGVVADLWSNFSVTCQLWIGRLIQDLTGFVSSNYINSAIFYSLVIASVLWVRSYFRQYRVRRAETRGS